MSKKLINIPDSLQIDIKELYKNNYNSQNDLIVEAIRDKIKKLKRVKKV